MVFVRERWNYWLIRDYRVDRSSGAAGWASSTRDRPRSSGRSPLKLMAPELPQSERFAAASCASRGWRLARPPERRADLRGGRARGRSTWRCARGGEDLGAVAASATGTLELERAAGISAGDRRGADAPRAGLVHRDVKPATSLDEDGYAYLMDFGVAKQLGGASTDTGGIVGTLDYLAPEQIRGEPATAAPTSTRSAACCTSAGGKPPFRRARGGWCRGSGARGIGSSTWCAGARKDRRSGTRRARPHPCGAVPQARRRSAYLYGGGARRWLSVRGRHGRSHRGEAHTLNR